ncbi:MAG: glucokinase [Alphaproteobacteria bacterium]|nr:glucokinase [Alphaproteobacteria bacterium]
MTEAVLVGDIGGTHARLARVDATGVHDAIKLRNDDHASMQALVEAWRTRTGGDLPRRAAFAVAGPITGDVVAWTNRPWSFSTASLQRLLGFDELVVLNDFEAVAWALPELGDDERIHLGGPPDGAPDAPMSALGPGTGLGVSLVVRTRDAARAVATEGGHVALAPADAEEAAVITAAFGTGRVAAEPVLCGRGLARLYATLAGLATPPAPETVTVAACAGHDAHAVAAVTLYLRLLGRYAGDVALMHGARGGVFLVGSILQTLAPLLPGSPLRSAFEDKALMRAWIREVPLWQVTAPEPALVGAAAALGVHRARSVTPPTGGTT